MAQLYSSVKELIHRISVVAGPELAEVVGALALPAVRLESKASAHHEFQGRSGTAANRYSLATIQRRIAEVDPTAELCDNGHSIGT